MTMLRTSEKMAESHLQPCPLYEEGFTGGCKDCFDRQECIMLTVLGKLQSLEAKLDGQVAK
jgi:hypothetical protein